MSVVIRVVDQCPRCKRPVEYGFVYGDRGVFWDTEIRSMGFPAEMLTQHPLGLLEPLPASRCRACKLLVFQHQASQPLRRRTRGRPG